MEYGSTPYVGMARKKMAAPYNAYKIIRLELGSVYSHRLYEPYHDISSVLISNTAVSVARKLRWSTTPASQHTGGSGPISLLHSLFSQASALMAEAITMIQARTNWIFSGVLHP